MCTEAGSADVERLARSMGGPSREVMALGDLMRARVGRLRALDLGSGAGRNAIYLAGLGAQVTAVDASSAHIRAITEIARGIGVEVDAVHARAEQYDPPEKYDLVLCHGILHFISKPVALEVVARLQANTAPGGVHVITIATFDSTKEAPASFVGQGFDGSLGTHDLMQAYRGWQCLAHESYVKRDYHPGEGYHLHPIEKLVFQHPDGNGAMTVGVHKHRLQTQDRPDVQRFLQADDLRETSRTTALATLGPPDFSFTHSSDGEQLSFNGVSTDGHELALLCWAKHAAYFENSILVGHSTYSSDFVHTFHQPTRALSPPPRAET